MVAAARRLVGAHPHVGAIVLECASMSPHRDAVAAALDIPVFGAAQLFAWFYAGLRRPGRYEPSRWTVHPGCAGPGRGATKAGAA